MCTRQHARELSGDHKETWPLHHGIYHLVREKDVYEIRQK